MSPPGTVPLRFHPVFMSPLLLEKIHRDRPEHGEVFGCVALANAALVLATGEIEPPVQGVRHGPMPWHTFPDLLGVRTKTADVVAPLIGGLVTLGPPCCDHDDGSPTHPILTPLQPFDRIRHGGAPAFHSSMAGGLGLMRALGQPPIRLRISPLAAQLDIGIPGAWMAFEREEVIRLLLDDGLGNLLLGPHRINRDETPGQFQEGQSLRDRRDLVALLLDGHLAQHETCLCSPSTHHVPRTPPERTIEAMP